MNKLTSTKRLRLQKSWRVVCFLLAGILLAGTLLAVTVLALPPLALSASNSHYRETFDLLQNTPEKSFHNLRHSTLTSLYPEDSTAAVQLINGNATGYLVYQVRGARSVSVTISTYLGTMVSRQQDGRYVLGYREGALGGFAQGRLSPSTGQVYTQQQGQAYRAIFEGDRLLFQPEDSMPPDTQPYGLQVRVSDGKRFVPVPLSYQTSTIDLGSAKAYETFTATIPAHAQAIEISINQMRSIEEVGLGVTPLLARYYTLLTDVTIIGSQLAFGGEKEEIIPEPELTTPPETSEEEASSAMEKKPSRKQYKADSEMDGGGTEQYYGAEVPSSDETDAVTSKFEGSGRLPEGATGNKSTGRSVGKSSGKQDKNATVRHGSAGQNRDESSLSTEEKVTDTPLPEDGQTQAPQVYEVAAPAAGGERFSTLVAVYIVVATGVILFLLLRPKGKDEEKD